jgi:transposase
VHFFERDIDGRRYRLVAESVWDSAAGRSVARQVVLGPADPSLVVDLAETEKVGAKRVGDIGALLWAAEQLDVVRVINQVCHDVCPAGEVGLGEMVLAVAVQRACAPGPKRDLAEFLEGALPRVSCLPAAKFTGQAFHRLASRVGAEQLEQVQIALARAAVQRFELSTSVLAYDTTNFDTYIATTTDGELAQRGHAKSKRANLRVVGLGLLVSETGQVPLLHRTYPGNGSDQSVFTDCLDGLGRLHDALDQGEQRSRPAQRTVVRDGGFWSEQLELDLDIVGYYSIISLPLGHNAAEQALQQASKPGAMRPLKGAYKDVRAARIRTRVGELDRTLVVVESQELLEGQKRGIAAALKKARQELAKLERLVDKGRITRTRLEQRVTQALRREHLSSFVVTQIGGDEEAPTLGWSVDARLRRKLERTRLGRRVLCTDRHSWSSERIVHAFRGQWNVEELFRRTKGGKVVPWGPSHQWADASIRLHTFATVLGLMLVSLAQLALQPKCSAKSMMEALGGIEATLVRPRTGKKGRPPTALVRPVLDRLQRRAVKLFDLTRWMPQLSSSRQSGSLSPQPETLS